MAKTILIVDDDPDFCSLLAEVFKKQPYRTITQESSGEALELIKAGDIDLVITDERMPEMSGCDLFRESQNFASTPPFIIVSAYLDSETVRNFINQGVGGFFIKPLNVFGLLKCSQDILRNTPKEEEEQSAPSLEENPLNFQFKSMPCRSPKSRDFALKLDHRKNFKSSLILIGEAGLPLKSIAKDLEALTGDEKDFFQILTPQTLSEERLNNTTKKAAQKGCTTVTFFVISTGRLTKEQQALLYDLSRQTGVFSTVPIATRFVFCLERPIEDLYEDGALSDKLYLMMGSSEIRIPSLSECPEDIIPLAEDYLRTVNEKRSVNFINFKEEALDVLSRHRWTRNHAELFNCIEIASAESRGASFITKDAIKNALKSAQSALPEVLKLQLTAYRNDYIGATLILTDGDFKKTAQLLNVSPELIKVVAD